MPPIPAHCDNCGLTWEPPGGIFIENSTNVTLRGNRINCPRCGHWARFIEGTFNVRDGVIELLSGPDWTRAKLRELQEALVVARSLLPTDAGAAVARVAEVDQRTAGLLLRQILASKELVGTTALLTVLLAAVGIMVTLYVSGKDAIKPEELQRIVDEQIQERLEQRRETSDPPILDQPEGRGSVGSGEQAPPA